jgi:hypothetical protein
VAEGKTYQSRLVITGNIDPRLFGDIKKLVGESAKITKQATELGKESKKAFEAFGKGIDATKVKVIAFSESLKGALLPLLGLGLAFKGFSTITSTIDAAVEKFERMRDAVAQFHSTLAATDYIAVLKKGSETALDALLAAYDNAATRAQEHVDKIFGKGMFRGIEQALVQTAGLSPGGAAKILEEIPIAYARLFGGLRKVTSDGAKDLAMTLGQFITSGRLPRILAAQLGISKEQVKEAAKETKEFRLQLLIHSRVFQNQQAYLKDQERELPNLVRLLRLRTENAGLLVKMGESWAEMKEHGEALSLQVEGALIPTLQMAGEALEKMFDSPGFQDNLNSALARVKDWMKRLFAPSEKDPLKDDFLGRLKRSMGEFGDWLKPYWDGLVKWLGDRWNDIFNPKDVNQGPELIGRPSAFQGIKDIITSIRLEIEAVKTSWTAFTTGFAKGFAETTAGKAPDVAGSVQKARDAIGSAENEILGRVMESVAESFNRFATAVMAPNFQAALTNMGTVLGKLTGVTWESLQGVVVDLSKAIEDLATQIGKITVIIDGLRGFAGSVKKATEDVASGKVPATEGDTSLGFNIAPPPIPAHAMGGIISTPQVGLIGEAGKESIVPLRQDANTLGIMQATFDALGIKPGDPSSWGQELFPPPVGGAFGGLGGGYVGGDHHTEYGPGVPGDQPGGPTYDWNSYHRVGAWPAITGPLRPGDVALGLGAQSRYGVRPGDSFTDDKGNVVRFADRSGSKDPLNEDHFKFAQGGIVTRKILSWIGERGREAVIPLDRHSMEKHGLAGGGDIHHHFAPVINVNGGGPDIAETVLSTLQSHFHRFLEDAAFEFQRRALS